MSVNPGRFADFFQAIHGHKPFPWQERLLLCVTGRRGDGGSGLLRRPWPEAMALPTGSGKTTCIDIAVFALACKASLEPLKRTTPRRIFFVVDRRVIVDEAFEHAKKLGEKLLTAEGGVLRDVADALRHVNGDKGQPPLTCHQLRGGMYRDDAWARTPTQPCVIASTVDQIGSRLLFRSYGRSSRSRPIHAGLAANDVLIILDEAHCANPFMQTLKAIERFRDDHWAQKPLDGPFSFTIMSATPPQGIRDVFSLDMNQDGPDLRDCDTLRRRIASSKPTYLTVASKAKGKNAIRELAVELVEHAAELSRDGRTRIVIFVNRVATARRVFALLRDVHPGTADASHKVPTPKVRKKFPPEFETILLTGRMRPIDRDRLLQNWVPANSPDNSQRGLLRWFGTWQQRPPLPHPVFVVATQCLEVGANLDFEAIVTECASLDALRQRFGRVDRIGRADCDCRGVIVVREDQTDPQNTDPIYGEAISQTWQWLNEHASAPQSDGRRLVDFGIAALQPLVAELNEEQQQALVPPAPDAPVMLPAHVDCWVQTSPIPMPDPDVSIFLRGVNRSAPEVQVCWRADIPAEFPIKIADESRSDYGPGAQQEETQFEQSVRDAVSLGPPTTLECMPVPLYVFRRWWTDDNQQDESYAEISDLEAVIQPNENSQSAVRQNAVALIWRGQDDSQLLRSFDDLRNGDTIVLPAALGGWELFGQIGLGEEVNAYATRERRPAAADVADVCQLVARQRPVLRLHPSLIETWPENPTRQKLLGVVRASDDDIDHVEARALLNELHAQGALPEGLKETVDLLLKDRGAKWVPHPFGGLVIQGKRNLQGLGGVKAEITRSETFTTEDDTASITTRVPLKEHCEHVAHLAARWGQSCGFQPEIVRSLKIAGKWHNIGKSDIRYQAFLHGGSLLRATLASEVYAKSMGLIESRSEQRTAWRNSNLPGGFRHEQLSTAIVNHIPELLEGEFDRDLVLHLIACHHGRCRPLADTVVDDSPPEIKLVFSPIAAQVSQHERTNWIPQHRLDSGVSERFWRLVRRYGWWGLAWLEAILVLADHRQSEAETERSEGTSTKQVNGVKT